MHLRDILKDHLLFDDLRLLRTGATLVHRVTITIAKILIEFCSGFDGGGVRIVFVAETRGKRVIHHIITTTDTASGLFFVHILTL